MNKCQVPKKEKYTQRRGKARRKSMNERPHFQSGTPQKKERTTVPFSVVVGRIGKLSPQLTCTLSVT